MSGWFTATVTAGESSVAGTDAWIQLNVADEDVSTAARRRPRR